MISSALTPLHRIPPYFWIVGAAAWMAFEIWRTSKQESKPKDITLTTFHPFVPNNLFSRVFDDQRSSWTIGRGTGSLSRWRGSKLELRDEETKDWLCVFGDKMSHSLLSLCVGLAEIKKPSGEGTEEANRRLFQLYFQATLAEASLQLQERGWKFGQSAPLLDRVAVVFTSRSLKESEHYNSFLLMSEEMRAESLAQQAVEFLNVHPDNAKHYRAAHVLARVMVMMLVSDAPRP